MSAIQELGREECLGLLARTASAGWRSAGQPPRRRSARSTICSMRLRTRSCFEQRWARSSTSCWVDRAAFEIDGIDEASRTGWSVIILGVTERSPTRARPADLRAWARVMGTRLQAPLGSNPRVDRLGPTDRQLAPEYPSTSLSARTVRPRPAGTVRASPHLGNREFVRPSSGMFNVLIAGGGVAALEAALALRELAGERVAITLLAPEPSSSTARCGCASRSPTARRSTTRSTRSHATSAPSSFRTLQVARPGASIVHTEGEQRARLRRAAARARRAPASPLQPRADAR